MNLAEPVQKNSKIHILTVGLLGMIIWISNFVHAGSFGVYEDDYIMVLPAIGRSFSELLSANWGYLCGWPQGRPAFWILTDTWIWLGYHLGGINALYLGAFFLQWICAIFVFKLLLRLVSFYPAFLGTVFFALFPPDTSKQIIMHQVVFPWMTLCLLTFFPLSKTEFCFGLVAVGFDGTYLRALAARIAGMRFPALGPLDGQKTLEDPAASLGGNGRGLGDSPGFATGYQGGPGRGGSRGSVGTNFAEPLRPFDRALLPVGNYLGEVHPGPSLFKLG